MLILDTIAAWSGELPAVLVAPSATVEARRELLRHLAARVLGIPAPAVTIRHRPDRPPELEGGALHLSSASRDSLAAFAIATEPVGVDVEQIAPEGLIPWKVLHPGEAEWLNRISDRDRPAAFARLWACKEAYVKALGLGLSRDPASFEVRCEGGEPTLRDPETNELARLNVQTSARHPGFVIALAVLPQPTTGKVSMS